MTQLIFGNPDADATTTPSGAPVPMSAMEEARALMERSKQRQAEATK
jgi:hypothetical protein